MTIRHTLTLLLACGSCAAALTGVRRFHEGNSLTDPMTARGLGLRSMAHALGYTNDSSREVVIAGTPIDWAWENRRDLFRNALTNGGFDYIILQPFRLVSPSWLEREMAAAAQVYRLALQSSSNAPLVIYATWVAVTTNEPIDQRFHDQMVTAIQVYCEYFVDVMQQEFPSNQVYLVPTGAALIELSRRLLLGQGPPGMVSITNWFLVGPDKPSEVHPTVEGYWLSSVLHFDSYYRDWYTGHPERIGTLPCTGIPYTIYWYPQSNWTQYPSLTPAQQTYLQQLAWLTMTNHPRTMLSTTPRQKPDMVPPSPPGDLRITNLLADRVTLLWNAATDNVGVTRYTVFTDNEWYVNVTTAAATVMLTNVLDPSRCTLKVRAWDAAYNFADAQILLPEPYLLPLLVFGCLRLRHRLPFLFPPSSLQNQ